MANIEGEDFGLVLRRGQIFIYLSRNFICGIALGDMERQRKSVLGWGNGSEKVGGERIAVNGESCWILRIGQFDGLWDVLSSHLLQMNAWHPSVSLREAVTCGKYFPICYPSHD